MPTRFFRDRSATDAAIALGVSWAAFVAALPVFEPDARSPSGIALGALVAAGLVLVGFASASRVRPMSTRPAGERPRLVMLTLGLGVSMALLNLAVNLWMASVDPTLNRLLVERFAGIPVWKSVLAAPVIEEVVFRLVCMSVVAVVAARFVKDRKTVFWIALLVSAFVFGVVHILRPEPLSQGLTWIYRAGVTLKSSVGGLLLGWIYWRWGLGYSIVCHGTVNGVHSLLEPLVFEL